MESDGTTPSTLELTDTVGRFPPPSLSCFVANRSRAKLNCPCSFPHFQVIAGGVAGTSSRGGLIFWLNGVYGSPPDQGTLQLSGSTRFINNYPAQACPSNEVWTGGLGGAFLPTGLECHKRTCTGGKVLTPGGATCCERNDAAAETSTARYSVSERE